MNPQVAQKAEELYTELTSGTSPDAKRFEALIKPDDMSHMDWLIKYAPEKFGAMEDWATMLATVAVPPLALSTGLSSVTAQLETGKKESNQSRPPRPFYGTGSWQIDKDKDLAWWWKNDRTSAGFWKYVVFGDQRPGESSPGRPTD